MFPRHGKFSVEVDSQMLIVNATGPFNEELVRDYKAAVDAAVAHLQQGHGWGQVIVLEKESLFTPDAERVLVQSLKNRKRGGLRASAVVLMENVTGRSLIKQQISGAYNKAGIEFTFSDTLAGAKAWLSGHL